MPETILIDSSLRKKENSSTALADSTLLPPWPLIFTNNSDHLLIRDRSLLINPNYPIGGSVQLSDISPRVVLLTDRPASLKKNSEYLNIHHPNHGLTGQSDNLISADHVEALPTTYSDSEDYPDSEKYYLGLSTTDGVFLGEFLEGRHQIYLLYRKRGDRYLPDPNYYLVKTKPSEKNIVSTTSIKVTFDSLYGIPLKILESPLEIIGREDYLTLRMPLAASIDPQRPFYSELTEETSKTIQKYNYGGGSNVSLTPMKITLGYPDPNYYQMPLWKPLSASFNRVRISSSLFPMPPQIKISGSPPAYYLISIKELSDSPIGIIREYGEMVDTFIPCNSNIRSSNTSILTIEIRDKNGDLIDFQKKDHYFTLEFD